MRVAKDDLSALDKLGKCFTSVDPLEEIDIGDGSIPRPMFVNKNWEADYKAKLIKLSKEYVDCFAYSYSEMPSLSHKLVEHRLPIKDGFRPYKKPSRYFNLEMYDHIKEKINRLLETNFIKPCRYADWISNILPVEKKGSGKLCVSIDFRNLNRATPLKMSIICN